MINYVSNFLLILFVLFFQNFSYADADQNSDVPSYSEIGNLTDEFGFNIRPALSSPDWEPSDEETAVELQEKNPKILIAGDSWATFACMYKALDRVLNENPAQLVNDRRCLRTSTPGITAREWPGSGADKRTRKFLRKNLNIKYLYLSLGGNDLMLNWKKSFTQKQTLELYNKNMSSLKKIIKVYTTINPSLKVVLSGYDFPHFKAHHNIIIYRYLYNRMEKPSDLEINSALVKYSQWMVSIADYKNIFYIQHLGLSQYYDGVPEFNFPLKMATHPDQISTFLNPGLVGGVVNLPSSEKSMVNWGIAYDAFHLNSENYYHLMMHTYKNVLVNIL